MKIQDSHGVIFDMDGVLVDSSDAHFAAWRMLGEEVGRPYPRDLFERTFGMHNRQILPLWLGSEVPPAELEELSARKEAMYREVAAATLRPIAGVVPLVRGLSEAGFRLAVGSSGPRPNVELALGVLGVGQLFHALATGDEVREGKPHPEIFQIAARKLELDPGRCLVVEDAPQGVKAGLAAGARVLAITTSRPRPELEGAHRVIDFFDEVSPPDVLALLGGPR